MKPRPLTPWILANAVGLGVGFLAFVQTAMFGKYGFDLARHWHWTGEGMPSPSLSA